jgi:WD40 repeat protein/serine/threonine protein kinase
MSPSASRPAAGDGAGLTELVEEFTNRLQAGEAVDVDAFVRAHPQYAEPLRRLLPPLQVLADLGVSAVSFPASGVRAARPADLELGVLGDFRIVREVGRGGMGVVYEAVQVSLNRRVALKVLPFASALDAKQLQRFQNEAQAAAQLHHTNIVPVYAVGCERGVHFYAMQFVEGQSLAALIADLQAGPGPGRAAGDPQATGPYAPGTPVPDAPAAEGTPRPAARPTERSAADPAFLRTAVTLGIQAALALDYAHELGVIHRDVKPANLLVDGRGHLWVADFGLAQVQGDARLTLTGDLLGTLRYMSPEQALAKRVQLDHRTDVYSLGVTLYELLTLRPAFRGRDRQEVLRQIAFEEPRPPRQLNRAIPWELETVVLKATAKNPAERYATAREFADDLRRFLDDRPIRARRPTCLQVARKWARRHTAIVWSVVVSAFLLLVALVVVLLVSKARIEAAHGREKVARDQGQVELYYQTIALAEREHNAGNVGRAERLLDSESCPEALHGWEWDYLKGLCRGTTPTLRAESALTHLVLSPDGSRLAAGGHDGRVTVWETRTWQARAFRPHAGEVRGLAFSRDGQSLWSVDTVGGTAYLWDIATGNRLASFGHTEGRGDTVLGLALSPDGRHLVSVERHGSEEMERVKVRDARTGRQLRDVTSPAGDSGPVAFSPDGRFLATTCAEDLVVRILDTATWQERFCLRGQRGGFIACMAFSPDSRLLATGSIRFWDDSEDNEVVLWDVDTGKPAHTLRGLGGGALSVAFSPDGRRLATGGCEDATIKIWDVASGREALTLRGHTESVWDLAFSPDGRRLYSASGDRTVRVWDGTPAGERAGAELQVLRGHEGRVNALAFTGDGRLVSGGMDRTVRLWDVPTGRELRTLVRGASPVYAVALSPDGASLATGSYSSYLGPPEQPELRVWDARGWQERLCVPFPAEDGGGILSLAFGPDNRRLALTTNSHPSVVDVATGRTLLNLRAARPYVRAVAYGCGGRVAWAGVNGEVLVWDEPPGGYARAAAQWALPAPLLPALTRAWLAGEAGPPQVLPAHDSRAMSVAFGPGDRRLASCGMDGQIKVWAREGKRWVERGRLAGHRGAVHAVAFSPDGLRLASAGLDGTVRLWDVEAGKQALVRRGHTNGVYAVAYSPDGRYLASGSSDGTVRIWDAQPPPEVPGQAVPD